MLYTAYIRHSAQFCIPVAIKIAFHDNMQHAHLLRIPRALMQLQLDKFNMHVCLQHMHSVPMATYLSHDHHVQIYVKCASPAGFNFRQQTCPKQVLVMCTKQICIFHLNIDTYIFCV